MTSTSITALNNTLPVIFHRPTTFRTTQSMPKIIVTGAHSYMLTVLTLDLEVHKNVNVCTNSNLKLHARKQYFKQCFNDLRVGVQHLTQETARDGRFNAKITINIIAAMRSLLMICTRRGNMIIVTSINSPVIALETHRWRINFES